MNACLTWTCISSSRLLKSGSTRCDLQAAESAAANARAAQARSEDAATETQLANINAMLQRACRAAGDGTSPCQASCPDPRCDEGRLECDSAEPGEGRASADHWLSASDRHGSGGDQAYGGDLHLNGEQVEIRVLAHSNKELTVRQVG